VGVFYAILTCKRSKPTSQRPFVDVSSREVGVFILSKSFSLVVIIIILIIIVERERERERDWVGSNIAPCRNKILK
jgi:hypothetical protein